MSNVNFSLSREAAQSIMDAATLALDTVQLRRVRQNIMDGIAELRSSLQGSLKAAHDASKKEKKKVPAKVVKAKPVKAKPATKKAPKLPPAAVAKPKQKVRIIQTNQLHVALKRAAAKREAPKVKKNVRAIAAAAMGAPVVDVPPDPSEKVRQDDIAAAQ